MMTGLIICDTRAIVCLNLKPKIIPMCQKIIENEFAQIWKKVDELLPEALNRKNANEVLKTEGLANLDVFFNEHRKTVKELLNDSVKAITQEQKDYLENLYDRIVLLIQNCIPEKGGYNCKQKVKYKEMVIIFVACFKKWQIS
jgi:hypothetical protein